jgi:hypothetical protein
MSYLSSSFWISLSLIFAHILTYLLTYLLTYSLSSTLSSFLPSFLASFLPSFLPYSLPSFLLPSLHPLDGLTEYARSPPETRDYQKKDSILVAIATCFKILHDSKTHRAMLEPLIITHILPEFKVRFPFFFLFFMDCIVLCCTVLQRIVCCKLWCFVLICFLIFLFRVFCFNISCTSLLFFISCTYVQHVVSCGVLTVACVLGN